MPQLFLFSGKAADDMLVAKLESVYMDSGDSSSAQVGEESKVLLLLRLLLVGNCYSY